LGNNTIKNLGSISILRQNQADFSVSSGDQNNFITFTKTPNEFRVAFIVPKSSIRFRLLTDGSAYSTAEGQLPKSLDKITTKENVSNIKVPDLDDSKILNTEDFRWPHKKAIGLDFNYIVGSNLIGDNAINIVKAEDNYLKSLGLVWQETQNGEIVSSTPIDKYDYEEGIYIGGLRVSYFLSNTFSLGANFRFYNYSQKLTVDKDEGDGTLININFIGPSFSYIFLKRNRIGISLKTDFAYAFGNLETIPALKILSDDDVFKDVEGLQSLIESNNNTTSISGIQANAGISLDYFIARWFYIDLGVHLNYTACNAKEELWVNTSKSFKSISPSLYIGLNMLLWNRLNE